MMTSFITDQHAPAEQVTVDGVTYEVAASRSVVDIDGDLPWHSGRWPMESWFVVSNLDSGGQRIGLQVQFMIQHLPAGADVVAVNVAVVNETSGTSRTFEYLHSLEQVEISADRLHISTPELKLSGDRHGCAVSFRGEHAQIDIAATAAAPPLLFNGEGQIVFLGVDEQYDYAFPAMPTTGTVVLDTATYEVTGASWLDRQWGGLPSFFSDPSADSVQAANAMNWIWSNPQLDNGVNVALAQVRDMSNHKIYLALTAVQSDGTHIVVTPIDPVQASEYWTSPATGRRYPTRCVFRAPQIGTELIVEVPFKQQEIISSAGAFTKFEGAATVTGTYQGQQVSGYGYLELVGNWS